MHIPTCPECGAEEPSWHAPRKFDLERLINAAMSIADRHTESKSGSGILNIQANMWELKELRSALEPYRNYKQFNYQPKGIDQKLDQVSAKLDDIRIKNQGLEPKDNDWFTLVFFLFVGALFIAGLIYLQLH